MAFGLVLMLMLGGLALAIGLGKVQQDSSFGLQDILGGLLVLCGSYSQWAFGGRDKGQGE